MQGERDDKGDRGRTATFDRRNNPGSDEGYDSDLGEDVPAPAAPDGGR